MVPWWIVAFLCSDFYMAELKNSLLNHCCLKNMKFRLHKNFLIYSTGELMSVKEIALDVVKIQSNPQTNMFLAW